MSALKPTSNTTTNTLDKFTQSMPVVATNASNAPDSLSTFQHSFGQFLRHQQLTNVLTSTTALATETKVTADSEIGSEFTSATTANSTRVTQLYQSLVFNNIRSFIDKCFPVCQTLISDSHWQQVSEQFFLNHPCHSPYFTEINQSFVDYLSLPKTLSALSLPPYFAELAHYEWMELLVDTYPDFKAISTEPDQLTLNPTLQNLHYQWPVHEINADNHSVSEQDSFFLIYRACEEVQFMQINAVTHALLDFIDQHDPVLPNQSNQLLESFAHHLGYADTQVIVDFGLPLLQQLTEQQVLITTSESTQNKIIEHLKAPS
ncbi:DUF2063 domain-containing protein [Psychrobacter sp. FDAARGOS_221]|uniref:HvfC family RiPP maturation protein n=1 Tax=Psychrobacter sp. FDAARGOS_221 TaxID=1975705 RepID=UPI00187D61D9|nr:putative DNA-binding domain-containing protein [Psychrobacter sp. FDAARGOS_221]